MEYSIQRRSLIGNKKGQLLQGLIGGVAGLVFGLIIVFVMISTLTGSNLLTAGSAEDSAVNNLTSNFTAGVGEVSAQIPTIFSIAVVVIIVGVLVLLAVAYKRATSAGGFGNGSL